MKKLLFIFFPVVFLLGETCQRAHAQSAAKTDSAKKILRANQDTSWDVNVLKAPSSPGAALIGTSPSVIQRPTDLTGFSASFLNATNNLSTIPNSYAVDFAPAWLFAGQHVSFDDFKSDKVGKNIWQTLDVSVAYKNVKDSTTNRTNTTVGVGIKISILRGSINSKTLKNIERAQNLVSQMLAKRTAALQKFVGNDKDATYLKLVDKLNRTPDADTAQKNLLRARRRNMIDSLNAIAVAADPSMKASVDSVKKIGQSYDFTRYGWKLDLAGGMSYYFPNQVYSSGSLNNAGAWLTGGYEDESSKVAFLGIARYLYNPKQAYADPTSILKQNNLSTFDTGFRLLFESADAKFTFGGELVYRSIVNTTAVPSSYHYSLNADYQVGKNQLLTFNIGRDFDGTITKGGNLIAALNFIIGFGSAKPVAP